MVAWNDREISRFQFRSALFMRRGFAQERAEFTADRLALRDQQRDGRRMCIECASLQQRGTCFAATTGKMLGVNRFMQPVQDLLQRCSHFNFQMPTNDHQDTQDR